MLRRASHALVALPLLVLPACSASAPVEPSASQQQPIVNGTPSTSVNDAIIKIDLGGGGFCSGTLIAPNLVITARHCLNEMDESSECGTFTTSMSAAAMSIRMGVNAGASVAKGKQIFVESGQNSGCSHDIGLLLLDRDIPNAKTAPVRLTKLTVGEGAWTAGYGDDGKGQVTPGRYEKGGLTIDAVGPGNYTYKTKQNQSLPVSVPPGEIVTGESTCFGDSGGPLLDMKGNVIGVTSRGIDDKCVDRPSIYSDTETHATLIRAAAKASGHVIVEAGQPTPGTGEDPEQPAPATNAPGADDDGDAPTGAPTKSAGSDDAEDDEEAAAKPSKKKKLTGPESAGCHAAGGGLPSLDDGWLMLLLGVVLITASRRRGARSHG